MGCLRKLVQARIGNLGQYLTSIDIHQAGMVIIQETGGFICGSKQNFLEGKKETLGEIMLGRRYCFIRAVAPSEVSDPLQYYHGLQICLSLSILFRPRPPSKSREGLLQRCTRVSLEADCNQVDVSRLICLPATISDRRMAEAMKRSRLCFWHHANCTVVICMKSMMHEARS